MSNLVQGKGGEDHGTTYLPTLSPVSILISFRGHMGLPEL